MEYFFSVLFICQLNSVFYAWSIGHRPYNNLWPQIKRACADMWIFGSGKMRMLMQTKIRTLPMHMPYAISAHVHVTFNRAPLYLLDYCNCHSCIKQWFTPYTHAHYTWYYNFLLCIFII